MSQTMSLEDYKRQFSEDDAVGWECMDKHLETVYGTQEPRHYAPALRWRLFSEQMTSLADHVDA